jgi:hypothetical protein
MLTASDHEKRSRKYWGFCETSLYYYQNSSLHGQMSLCRALGARHHLADAFVQVLRRVHGVRGVERVAGIYVRFYTLRRIA